jgi:hypothetical protein
MQLQIPNRITAAEATRATALSLNNGNIEELTEILERCYSEIRREVECCNSAAYVHLDYYPQDGYVMREALRILGEDGFQVELKGTHRTTLDISWPHLTYSVD